MVGMHLAPGIEPGLRMASNGTHWKHAKKLVVHVSLEAWSKAMQYNTYTLMMRIAVLNPPAMWMAMRNPRLGERRM